MTGLYLHIPFCEKKCFYCAFITAVNQKHHADEYARSLAREMCLYQGEKIGSVYFGGGTPSLLSEERFLFLVASIKKYFKVADDAECTVEMNPEDVTASKLRCYPDAGVTRISLGVQTFNDSYLKFLGRCHNRAQALNAYHLIRDCGHMNVNIDLMYGFPEQTRDDIDQDLNVLQGLSCDHVSLYTLTVEEGSRFFRDKHVLPDAEAMADHYLFVRKQVLSMGFEHYEVSNFARPGRRSVHNINYWQGGNYIGLGVAAHSHQDGCRSWNVSRLRTYIEKMRREGSAKEGQENLSLQQRLGELLVFGLRMLEGVDMEQIQLEIGVRFSDQQRDCLGRFISDGYLRLEEKHLSVTEKGLVILDELSPYLL